MNYSCLKSYYNEEEMRLILPLSKFKRSTWSQKINVREWDFEPDLLGVTGHWKTKKQTLDFGRSYKIKVPKENL